VINLFLVVVHEPHQSIVCPFSSEQRARQYFKKILLECSKKYGVKDVHDADLEHCYLFGRYEIFNGYFIQLYEAELDREDDVKWL
jgi:hypothetical protein